MHFEPLHQNRIPRRAFLIMPVAFAGWMALFRRPERQLPDAAENGTGPLIKLVLLQSGQRKTAFIGRVSEIE